VANLSTCSFGDPSAPLVGGRSISQIASMSVFAGTSGYYAGPVAQAREAFETGRNNAASVEPVNGLGDDACWDRTLRTLNVLEVRFELEVTIASDAGGLDQARSIALKHCRNCRSRSTRAEPWERISTGAFVRRRRWARSRT